MAEINGTNVAAKIVPFTTEDQFATHVSTYGQGGWHEVANNTERDNIPADRRLAGMAVFVNSDKKLYTLDADLTTWTLVESGKVDDIQINGTSIVNNKVANITVEDNITSTSTTNPLSANMGKYLQEEIDAISGRGRYLTLWNCATGLAETNPPESSYTYKTGDYFIVGTIASSGGTNYRPDGTSYTTGVASTTVETDEVSIDDTYIYDGSTWHLQYNSQKTVTFTNIDGSPYDNTNLANALNAKQDLLPDQTGHDGQFLKSAGSQLLWADPPSYMEDLQYFGIKSNPAVWTYSTVSWDMVRPNRITTGHIYTVRNNSIVMYEDTDTTTEFGNDLPRVEGKKYTLFYGPNLTTELSASKNYVWVDSDNIYVSESTPTLETTDAVWFSVQYGGGYLIGIKYTNDGGTTWSEVSIPLMERNYNGLGADYNLSANFYRDMKFFVENVQYILPYGKTEEGKYKYTTVTQFAGFSRTNVPENYNGYLVRAPWTTTIGTYTANADNYGVFTQDGSEQTYVDTSASFCPLAKIVNGEFSVTQVIVPIDTLQVEVNDLYNVKADRKEVEVVNSKLEAGIVSNPALINYIINGRTLTVTGGYYWNIGSIIPGNEWDDMLSEIYDEGYNMSVNIPEGTGKYFVYYNYDGEEETLGYSIIPLTEELFYQSASENARSMSSGNIDRWYEKEDPTTHDKVYTPNSYANEGDRIFRKATLQNGLEITEAVGYITQVDGSGNIVEYQTQYGELHTCNYQVTENIWEFVGQDKETILSAEYLPSMYGWTDPRTQLMHYKDGGGNGMVRVGQVYWDGSKFVDQRSIEFVGCRVNVYPNVRCLMNNGINESDQAQMVDYTVQRTIVEYTTPEMDGDYYVILTADDRILFSKNIRTDIASNTFYVDNTPTVGCRIAVCTVHNMIFESWEVDVPFRFATTDQLDGKVDKTSEPSRVYGTDAQGNQTTFSATGFGLVDDVQIYGESKVENKVADLEVVEQFSSLPIASVDNAGRIVQFTGTTGTYIHGFIYESKVSGEPSSAICDATDSATLYPSHVQVDKDVFETQISTNGEYMFHYDGTDWTYNNSPVNLEDYGISIDSGATYSSGDNVYILYTESTLSYFWSAIPVQPEAGTISNAEIDEMWS